jgi:hypothetical protein
MRSSPRRDRLARPLPHERTREGDSVSYKLTLEIPRLPKLQAANGREHWRVRYNEERWWKHQVGWHAMAKGLPRTPLTRARIVCVRRSTTEPDHDNLAASFKPAIDGLKLCGVIEDDKPAVIGKPEYGWERAKRGQGGVRILVEAIE